MFSTSSTSDLGSLNLDDVSPSAVLKTDPCNLGLEHDKLKIASLNINSLLHSDRLQQIEDILKWNNISALCLQETKLCPDTDPSCFTIPNYVAYSNPRTRRGGGVLIFVRSDITSRQLIHLENKTTHLEHVCAEIYVQGKRILLSSFYRPPSCNKEEFKNCLYSTLSKLQNNSPAFNVIAGDINYGGQYDFYNTLPVSSFDLEVGDIFQQHSLCQLIDIFTRVSSSPNYSVSLLDHIYIDRTDIVSSICVWPGLSDHNGVCIQLNISCKKPKKKTLQKYQFNDVPSQNINSLKTHIQTFNQQTQWTSDQHAEELTRHLITGLERFIPKVSFPEREHDCPWSSSMLRRILRRKHSAYKVFRQSAENLRQLRPTDRHYYQMRVRVSQKESDFKKASNEYKKASRHEKNKYFSTLKNVWSNPNISSKKKFGILQKLSKTSKNASIPPLLQSGKIFDDSTEKANLFNRFFCDKSQVPNPNEVPPNLEKIATHDKFEHINTSHYEIGQLIKTMKSSNYSPCGVSQTFIKFLKTHTGLVISKHISDLFNRIFSTGCFPQCWKVAHLTPIFKKKGSKSEIENYRPISILPTLSKLCEMVIHSRLLTHLVSNSIISKVQAAYLPGDSTTQQLISLIHNIKTTMSSKNIAHAVFLDVSKAFDAIWHQGLLAKLEQINISGEAFKLFNSYLEKREAVTVVDGHKSSPLPLKAGVPQGSSLGPLLFIIFINDLVSNLETTPFLFADDCTLLAKADSTFETTNQLNRDLTKIFSWSLIWKVNFNASKSCEMIFSKSYLISQPLILGLQIIERVHLHKHLGIYIQSNLSWEKQVTSIVKKVNMKLSIINSVKGLSRQCLDVLYKLHVRSSIDYGILVFGPSLNQTQLKTLDNLNYRAAKLVVGAQKYTSFDKIMRELAWEDTSTRLHYLCVTQFYKIIHHMTTPLVRECLPPRLNSVYPTNRTFQHYPLMDNFFMNSYFPYTIKKWDQLDPALRVEPDFDLFKIKLKQQLKPAKYKHYHCGFKLGNKLHAQLRLGRSSLNSHLFSIGLSDTKACPCGFYSETAEHFLLDCIIYENIRGQLYQKLEGLLEKKLSTYSKKDLFQIMLCGEKPHLPEKFYHNKSIFFSVQTFLCKSKRLLFPK